MLSLKRSAIALFFTIATTLIPWSALNAATVGCDALLERAAAYPATISTVQALEAFAEEHALPTQIREVGPKQRKVSRLFVGLDISNPELVKAYLEKFNLDAGTLALEFQNETVGQYVTGVLRPSADPEAKIYRWGRPDLTRPAWITGWLMRGAATKPIIGYSHLLGISEAEKANVKNFLDHPELRGKCKSDNCVAWTSSIELGTTAKESTDDDRRYLFTELGVARSMAHFEIGRRLIHAANERHGAIVVFFNGGAGLEAFQNHLAENLPPDPQIPYNAIIRGLDFADDDPVMEAIRAIPDGAKVFVPIAAGASPEAVQALIQQSTKTEKGYDVTLLVNGISEALLRKGVTTTEGKFRAHALFLGGNMRKLYDEKLLDYNPGYLSDLNRWVADPAQENFQYDAILVRVAPADAAGHYSLGPNCDQIMGILRARPEIKVIAEVNPNVPRTKGENFITDAQITSRFASQTKLAGPPVVPVEQIENAIGANLAELIPNNSYLQVGIGNVFGGLPQAIRMKARQGLHIFTEMFGDTLMTLMQYRNALDAKTGFAFGSDNLYKALPNLNVEFVETTEVNDPGKVAALDGFVAVNTALQVNLWGDVNATMGPNRKRVSSPGGQVEFMAGAARSKGGKAVIAIRSTAKNGELSTIVLDLYDGPVTTPHESVTHVVTEYGTASLAGKSESERALALIRIAHPKFRAQLLEEAMNRKMITRQQAEGVKRD